MNNINRKLKKWLLVISIICVFGFLFVFILNKSLWNSMVFSIRSKIFLNNITKLEQKYKNDKYGGTTPEETYRMFLDALKNKNIDLASKYFILDKQEEYKKALYEVEKNDKWGLMMEDLNRVDTARWEKIADDYVNLELFTQDNVLAEQITFVLMRNILPPKTTISNIWKIASF